MCETTSLTDSGDIQKKYMKDIENASDAEELFSMIRKSYQMAFLKYTREYMAVDDFSRIFSGIWIRNENPNRDPNVTIKTLIQWLRASNKEILMKEAELEVYRNYPEKIKIYRGVAVNRNPKGLSWTENIEKAEWFAERFNRKNKKGVVQEAYIAKENVLAYFNRRGEDEIVVDARYLEDLKVIGAIE
mgnify:CR=1 FL=1